MATLDTARLAREIRARRKARKLTVRDAAKEAGVSPATLWRAERGARLSDLDVLGRISGWLGLSLDALLIDGRRGPKKSDMYHGKGESTLEMIEAHLRADSELDQETAEFLAKAFRQLYKEVPRSSG